LFKKNLLLICLTTSISTHASNVIITTNNTPMIFGNTYISTGAGAKINGDIVANTSLVVGENTVVIGNIQAAETVQTGATTRVEGNINAGSAITLGPRTVVNGEMCYATSLTQGVDTKSSNTDCQFDAMTYNRDDVIATQDVYTALTSKNMTKRNQLNPKIPQDLTLSFDDDFTKHRDGNTIVYNATSLTTAAGITLTLDGSYDWVFNITDMLTLGAGTTVELAEGSKGSVTWNIGGFASIGADAQVAGVIFANGYITTGSRAKVKGRVSSESYCSALFSATSFVKIGASSTVSCEQTVIEPVVFALGDTGPGGGIVFRVNADGLTGFEAAPEDYIFSVWGCVNETVRSNSGCKAPNSAHEVAQRYRHGGIDGWYLPNTQELLWLSVMNTSSRFTELSGSYWSRDKRPKHRSGLAPPTNCSRLRDPQTAIAVSVGRKDLNVTTLDQDCTSRSNALSVRPVRKFKITRGREAI
jgi:carbonic anhydrase/acetyltransferase-like protein (isoleucine patch superfamily)